MSVKSSFLAAGLSAAMSLGVPSAAIAHGGAAAGAHGQYGCHQSGVTGPGVMGQGMGPGMMGQGMGPGMMGQGMGPGMMRPLRQDLSVGEVRHMLSHFLAANGNPNVKLGKVEEKDEDSIVAEIVTQDGSLVRSITVDRHTGWMRPAP